MTHRSGIIVNARAPRSVCRLPQSPAVRVDGCGVCIDGWDVEDMFEPDLDLSYQVRHQTRRRLD
jgi:hypothetical protein